jgi:hypothetical protein
MMNSPNNQNFTDEHGRAQDDLPHLTLDALDINLPSAVADFETFKSLPNPLNEEGINSILSVTKNWIRYGGDFYTHLTGKDPLLERGVESGWTSDEAARDQKVLQWLNKDGNSLWIKEAKTFHAQNKDIISCSEELFNLPLSDGSVAIETRYTTNYIQLNKWLYFDTNNFSKTELRFSQPERETDQYRVYFSVNPSNVFSTFQDLIKILYDLPELKKFGFQIKTPDLSEANNKDISRIMNQKDRIVLYLGEEGMRAAFPVLQKYAVDNRDIFKEPGIPLAQPLVDPRGLTIQGIAITSCTEGRSPDPNTNNRSYSTFNEMQSEIIESSYRSIINALREPSKMRAMTSEFPTIRWEMERISPAATIHDYLKTILARPEGADFLSKYLSKVYPQWASAFGLRKDNTAFKAD